MSEGFTVTEVVRRLDGTTTQADLPPEVVEAATAHRLQRQTRTIGQRLRRGADDLRRVPEAFRRGLVVLAESSATALIHSPAGAQLGGNPNPPESRPPAGGDRALRADLVRCSQRLMAADRAVLQWDWPDEPQAWEPDVAYKRRGLVMCDADGVPCWRDPDDLTTRLVGLGEVELVCARLTGQLRALSGFDWPDEADVDADIADDVARQVSSAVGSLRHAGVWSLPHFERVCGNCGAPDVYAKERCTACYEYERRNGRERPQHLWRAA